MVPTNISAPPLVSAVVPAYNAERYLAQTLGALITQSYANVEIIVVDDGSEDKTLQIAQTIAREYSQVRVFHQSNQGVAAARNRGIAEARGEFIALVDADDIWHPDAVAKLAHCLSNADALTGVAYGWSVTIDEHGSPDGDFCCSTITGNVLRTLLCHNFIGTASATMIRRQCFAKVGGYDPHFRAAGLEGCEDWDLYLRIAQYYQFTVVPEFLFSYRRAWNSMSANAHAMAKSHGYLLEKVKRRHSRTPRVFYQISTSSFYLHLARIGYMYNNPSESLYWLRQALVKGSVFTLARAGFYELLVKNMVALLGSSIGGSVGYSDRRTPIPKTGAIPRKQILQVADIEKKRVRIFFKLAAQTALHRLIQWLT